MSMETYQKRSKKASKAVTAQIQGWLRKRCKVGKRQKVASNHLRSLCRNELRLTFSDVHFGRALRAIYPDARTHNQADSGVSNQFIYGIILACPPYPTHPEGPAQQDLTADDHDEQHRLTEHQDGDQHQDLAEHQDSAEHCDPTEHQDLAEHCDPAEHQDSAEYCDPAEHQDSAEHCDPAEHQDSAEHCDPAEHQDSAEYGDSEHRDRAEHQDQAEHQHPAEHQDSAEHRDHHDLIVHKDPVEQQDPLMQDVVPHYLATHQLENPCEIIEAQTHKIQELQGTIKVQAHEIQELLGTIEAQSHKNQELQGTVEVLGRENQQLQETIEVLEQKLRGRRPQRICSSEIKKKEHEDIVAAVLKKQEDGLKVVAVEGKGRGVIATKPFQRGDFIVEYAGELVTKTQARILESEYLKTDKGCYLFYFKCQDKSFCIDATPESEHLGRLVNHSRTGSNCKARSVMIGNHPHLVLLASTAINPEDEILYDYGDRSRAAIQEHPWLGK